MPPDDARDPRTALLDAVLDHLPHAVLAVDRRWRVTVANARARALLDRAPAAVAGAALWELFPGLSASEVGRCCRQAAADGRAHATDAELPGWPGVYRVHAVPAPEGGLVLHARDITAEQRLDDGASGLADRDVLTGAANRRALTTRLAEAVARARAAPPDAAGRGAAVLLLDLDGFGAVNAAHGHDAGDRLLRQVAERLGRAARGGDTVARVAADEFAVLLAGVAPGEEEAVGARFLAALAAPFAVAEASDPAAAGPPRTTAVTACLGTVVVDGEAEADAVLRDAGVALQRARAAGPGRLARSTPALRAEARAREALAAALRGAVDRAVTASPADSPDGAFSLAYQPVVDLRTGVPTGVEALLRWHHPTLGPVSPATFIPLAEELGLIAPLGAWVLRAACAAIAGLGRAAGAGASPDRTPQVLPHALPNDVPNASPNTAPNARPNAASVGALADRLTVAVNVSGHQLQAGGFADEVAAALAAGGLAPGRLTVEVTETALVRDPRRARRVLGELRAAGVRVAIDDFGTGYSSLGYLQQLPLDVLKIDKRFVDGVAGGGGPGVAIPRAIVALGGALGLRTVAEGVETAAQRDALHALGCGYGQGYLFARPLALADLAAWLDAWAWAEGSAAAAA